MPTYGAIYNYDVFYAENNALTYQIDVTKPVGKPHRQPALQGRGGGDSDDFIVATNDYRAGGGGAVPGIDGSKTIIKSPDANQAVVSNYLLALAGKGAGKVTWPTTAARAAGVLSRRPPPVR